MPAGKLTLVRSATKQMKSRRKIAKGRLTLIGGRARVNRGLQSMKSTDPFPAMKFATLRYAQTIVMNTSATAFTYGTSQVMHLNSIFDPDLSGVGHQPYGHDEMASLYNKYKVLGVNIDITIMAPSTPNGALATFLIQPQAPTFIITSKNVGQAAEKPGAVTRFISDTGDQKTTYKLFIPIYKALGITKKQFDADTLQYSANFGASPAALPTLLFATAPTASAALAHTALVKMNFICQFWDRKVQVQS